MRPLLQALPAAQRTPSRGCRLLLELLSCMEDARRRFLSPSVSYLSLELLYLRGPHPVFPIVPFPPDKVQRLPASDSPSFFEECRRLFHLQPDLAAVLERYASLGRTQELQSILREELAKEQRRPPLKHRRTSLLTPDTAPLPDCSELEDLAFLEEIHPHRGLKKAGHRALLADRETVIGRDDSRCDYVLRDPYVGRRHARILRQGALFFLEDLSSGNGTILDGRRLNRGETCLMPNHCTLRLGCTVLRFSLEPRPSAYLVPNRRSPASPRPGTM